MPEPPSLRHGRACPGHPSWQCAATDGRHKACPRDEPDPGPAMTNGGNDDGGEPQAPGVFRQLHGSDRQRDHRPARRHRPGAARLRHARGRQLDRDHPGARLPDPAARRTSRTVVRRCRAAGALPQHAGDQLHRRRLRHDRRRCLHRGRRHRGQPVRHQLGAGGRARTRDDAVAVEEDRAVRTRDEAHARISIAAPMPATTCATRRSASSASAISVGASPNCAACCST